MFSFAAALALATVGSAEAQHDHSGHSAEIPAPAMEGHPIANAAKGDQGPASQAYAEANRRMHAAMDLEFTGNADLDFAAGMIAHHRGAIDMAKIVLEHGKDPEIRDFAEGVIAAQSAEIEFLEKWIAENR
jgi:uncharacterized protein (DUF305 family)